MQAMQPFSLSMAKRLSRPAREEATSRVVDAEVRAEAKPAAPVVEKKAAPRKSGRGRLVLSVIVLAALAGGAYYGHEWWTNGRFMVSTDDAYIGGDINYVAPKVGGYVKTVNVKANDYVKAGDALVTLDDGDYKIALEQARAQLATQQLSLKSIDAQRLVAAAAVQQAQAKLKASEAALHGAQLTQDRASKLQSQDVASASSLDKANVALEQAQADVGASNAAIESANANIKAIDAQHAQAESAIKSMQLAIDKAERDESFTVLRAPFDGIVGNLSVQEGDLVSPGMRLAAVVRPTRSTSTPFQGNADRLDPAWPDGWHPCRCARRQAYRRQGPVDFACFRRGLLAPACRKCHRQLHQDHPAATGSHRNPQGCA